MLLLLLELLLVLRGNRRHWWRSRHPALLLLLSGKASILLLKRLLRVLTTHLPSHRIARVLLLQWLLLPKARRLRRKGARLLLLARETRLVPLAVLGRLWVAGILWLLLLLRHAAVRARRAVHMRSELLPERARGLKGHPGR